MTVKQLKEWHKWVKQYKNGYHLSKTDEQELIRLNHRVMEDSHEIHNNNMLNNRR